MLSLRPRAGLAAFFAISLASSTAAAAPQADGAAPESGADGPTVVVNDVDIPPVELEPRPEAVPEPEPAPQVVPEPAPAAAQADPEPPPSLAAPTGGPASVAEPLEPTDFGDPPLSALGRDGALDADRSLQLDKAHGWRNGGIAGLVVGTGLIVSSALMLTSDPAAPKLGNSNFEDARNRAGYTMLAPGVLIAAGGAAMLTVGLLQERRLRVSAMATSDAAAVSIAGRF